MHQFGHAIPGAAEFLKFLMSDNIPFTLITNECRYTRIALQAKLQGILGVEVPKERIYTCANAARDFVAKSVASGWRGNIFVVGEEGMVVNVKSGLSGAEGCRVVTGTDDFDGHCDFVIIGTVVTGGPNDNWIQAERASDFLRKGAKLLYSNPDWFEVASDGSYKFGCPMPTIDLLMQTTGCSAYNLGKPNPWMLRCARDQLIRTILSPLGERASDFVRGTIDPKDFLFVGDSLNTDVRTAIENDIDAALVLSGTTTKDSLMKSSLQPNWVFDSIAGVHESLQEGKLVRGGRNHSF